MPPAKQTIAIIGIENNVAANFAKTLCENNCRTVIFDENINKAKSAEQTICRQNAAADIEVMECKHLASWEADMIVIATERQKLTSVAEKILDVSTQKIVVIITEELPVKKIKELEKLFPHSKVAVLFKKNTGNSFPDVFVYSRHGNVLQEIKKLTQPAEYTIVAEQIL